MEATQLDENLTQTSESIYNKNNQDKTDPD